MPIYVYRCESCGAQVERRQSFSEAPLTECERCHGTLRKVLSPAAVIFKGSGFYVTDNPGKSGSNGRSDSGEKNGHDTSETKSETKSDSTSNGKSADTAKTVTTSDK